MKRNHLSRDKSQEDNDGGDNNNHHNYYKNSSSGQWHHQYQEGSVSWPPRNYTCSFCRREFKSAQALGGHMNVHRRDRAKLRQLPSWIFESPHVSFPNPNPFLSSSSSTPHEPYPTQTTQTSAVSSPNHGDSRSDVVRTREFKNPPNDACHAGKCRLTKDLKQKIGVADVIDLELDMGFKDPTQQVLDLELRLGCFN